MPRGDTSKYTDQHAPRPDSGDLLSCAIFLLQLEVESEAPYPSIRHLVGKRRVAAQLALGFVAQTDRIVDEKIRRCCAINAS
jgi:hypothetical protein